MSAAIDFTMTAKEAANARAALRFLRAKCGSWVLVARALHIGASTPSNVAGGHSEVSPMLVFRIARFARVGVDDILAGRFPEPGVCPHCDHKKEDAS